MSKAEEFIQENTRNCSQLHYNSACTLRHCITPDQARKAVEIAREEVVKKAVEWLDKIYTTQEPISLDDIESFKKYMEESV